MESSNPRLRNLRRVIDGIVELPTLPVVVVQIAEVMDNPKSSAADLARLISSDQALTAKILKIANSAFYGFPRRIATVNLAVVVLGFDAVKHMALSISVLEEFSGNGAGRLFDREKFWEHSIGCGVAGRLLAKELGYRLRGQAFVAGILHDLGKLIFAQHLRDGFAKSIRLANQEDLFLREAEKRVLGVTHDEVGGWLAERWNLPKQLVEAICYHHTPSETQKNMELVALTHLADALCRKENVGSSGDSKGPLLDNEALEMLSTGGMKMSEESLFSLGGELHKELQKAEVFISMIRGESKDGR